MIDRDELHRWEQAPLGDLIDYIMRAYHRPLPGELARAISLARGPAAVGRAPVERLRELVVEHLREEEELVFPWLRSRERASAGVLVHLLERDHRDIECSVGELDALIAPLADHPFAVACREVARALRALFRLEGQVLFPRALVGAG